MSDTLSLPAAAARSRRRRRAALLTTGLGVLLLLPIALLIRFDRNRVTTTTAALGLVPLFLLQDAEGVHLSRFDLEGHLTLIANLGATCVDTAAPRCVAVLERLGELTRYVEARLLYSNETEQTPIRLISVATSPVSLGVSWRRVQAQEPAEAATFVPPGRDAAQPSLVLVDQAGEFVYWRDLDRDGLTAELRPLLSRLTINHYMQDYLAKRTFFRRTPKTQSAN